MSGNTDTLDTHMNIEDEKEIVSVGRALRHRPPPLHNYHLWGVFMSAHRLAHGSFSQSWVGHRAVSHRASNVVCRAVVLGVCRRRLLISAPSSLVSFYVFPLRGLYCALAGCGHFWAVKGLLRGCMCLAYGMGRAGTLGPYRGLYSAKKPPS